MKSNENEPLQDPSRANLKLYHEKLELAKGNWSINHFAKEAGISPSNLWKMFHGQIAIPETLEKIAKARPDLEYLYSELLLATGRMKEEDFPESLKSTQHDIDDSENAMVPIPILNDVSGQKGKLLFHPKGEKYYYPKKKLGDGKYFLYPMTTDEMSPKLHQGDMVLFDMSASPKNYDIVLFRLQKKKGVIRYYCKQNAKIIAYTTQVESPPTYYNKGEIEVLGVAVSAFISL